MGSNMYLLFVGIQIICIVLAVWALALLLHRETTREQKMMTYFMFAVLVQNVAYLFELTSRTAEAAMVAVKLEYMGSVWIMIFFSRFMLYYTLGKEPKWVIRFLEFTALVNLLMMWTCQWHPFFYREIHYVMEGNFPHFVFSYGIFFYSFMLFNCMIPYGMTLAALFYARKKHPYRLIGVRYQFFCIVSVIPPTCLFLYVGKFIREFDPSPPLMSLMLSLTVIFVWSKRNYDLGRSAAEKVLYTLSECVILLDEDKRIASFNAAATKIFRTLNVSCLGMPAQSLDNFPTTLLESSEKQEFSFGGKDYEGHVNEIFDSHNKLMGYVVFFFDVTDTNRYIRDLEEMRVQAEAANVAKSEFLANMSHEIRTPMNAIVGLSNLIKEECQGRKVYSLACDVEKASKNLLTIINDILDLSKVEAGKMELSEAEYSIRNVVLELQKMMDVVASMKGLELRCVCSGDLPCGLYGDAGRIRQILINLLNNAVKFTKTGTVSLIVEGKDFTEDTVTLVCRVEDTGIGIREEDLEKIFDNFKQLDSKKNRNAEGTGLGLSISRQLAKLMHGNLTVESVYGEGSVFTVTFPQKITDAVPLSQMPVEMEEVQEDTFQMFTAYDYRILVVDDNVINRKVAMGILKPYGCELEEAESGQAAIEMVKQSPYDLIFMDYMMPDMDGLEAARIIRRDCGSNGKNAVLVALTANAMEGAREMFLENEFEDFLSKPIGQKELNQILAKWIPDERKSRKGQKREARITLDDISEISMNGINIRNALDMHSGTLDDYMELLYLYYIDGEKKDAFLRELVQKGDYKNYGIEIHALKSASANIGARELSMQAKKLEKAAAEGNKEYLDENGEDFLTDYRELLLEIEKVLRRKHLLHRQNAGNKKPPVSGEMFLQGLTEALTELENFKAKECSRKLEELLTHEMPGEMAASIEKIQIQLKKYDDDGAEEALRSLVRQLREDKIEHGKAENSGD